MNRRQILDINSGWKSAFSGAKLPLLHVVEGEEVAFEEEIRLVVHDNLGACPQKAGSIQRDELTILQRRNSNQLSIESSKAIPIGQLSRDLAG